MARQTRFELVTHRFVVCYSIQLSYWRMPFRKGLFNIVFKGEKSNLFLMKKEKSAEITALLFLWSIRVESNRRLVSCSHWPYRLATDAASRIIASHRISFNKGDAILFRPFFPDDVSFLNSWRCRFSLRNKQER